MGIFFIALFPGQRTAGDWGFRGKARVKAPACPRFPLLTLLLRTSGSGLVWGPQSVPSCPQPRPQSRGSDRAHPQGLVLVTRLCMVLSRFRSAPHLPEHPSQPPRLPVPGPPPPQFHRCLQAGPSSPLRWTPPALSWPTGDTHLPPSLRLSPSPCPPCSASLTFFWSFIPSFLFSGLLAISPPKLHHPPLEASLDPAGQRRLSTSHLATYGRRCWGVLSAWLPLHSAEFQRPRLS